MSGMSFIDINDPSKSAVQGSPPVHHAASSNYESTCRSHFKWGGCGAVKIEIVDIDRFNEDIFMGEVTISSRTQYPAFIIVDALLLLLPGHDSFVFIARANQGCFSAATRCR